MADQSLLDSTRETFRQYLRQADKLIIEGKFSEAKVQIVEAKKIDPRNPFIIAFEERISLFESKTLQGKKKTAIHPTAKEQPVKKTPLDSTDAGDAHVDSPLEPTTDNTGASREIIEQQLRQQIEAEYKTRFTQELRKAEERAAHILAEEREKIDAQQQALNKKFEQQLQDAQRQLELAFQKRLDEEIAKAEERLSQQHEAEIAFIETDMKAELSRQYEADIQVLQGRMKQDQDKLLVQEKHTFQEHEQILKEQFNQKLLDALRKAETLFQEQSKQQIQIEREKIENDLRSEYEKKVADGQDTVRKQFDDLKTKLEESYHLQEKELNDEAKRRIDEQVRLLRELEEEKYNQQRVTMREELEREYQKKAEAQISTERVQIERRAEEIIEAEKNRHDVEIQKLINAQNVQIQEVRTELRNEMEEIFLARLERIAEEYDHKLELLGAKVPDSKKERLELYRRKMLSAYESGQPSVDDARALMQLKELLELTFDEHLTIESDIRFDLYTNFIEKRVISGEIEATDSEALDQLKQQFNITPEDSLRLEPYILSCFQRHNTKGRLLVVDDDILLLKMLEDLLIEGGYQVITSPDIPGALEKLNTQSFDLILSDIKFGDEVLDGFSFFQSVQEQTRLRHIPFIFMSALHDGVIVRSGIQLGVDDYITKPMEPDLLLATIEGKLKRYRSITQ
jgi:CheY-like chemotaxis protein